MMDNVLRRPEYIRELALMLFDQTQPLHELDDMDRQVLAKAAMTVDQSLHLTKKRPLKAIHRMLKTEFGEAITQGEAELLVPVIALQTDRVKRKDIVQMDMPPLQQRAILTLAALLKIAAGLDASESQSTTIHQVELARKGMWIVVDGPQVQVDAPAAEHEARLWEKIGYPRISVLERTEAQRIKESYSPVIEVMPILPTDSLTEAGRKVMRQHFVAMLNQEEGTRHGENIEALHDMRVATRRMRASFEVFGNAFEPKALKPHLKGLRATGRALGRVRDLDVFMEKAQKYLDEKSQDGPHGLDSLLQSWQAQREKARATMLAYLDSKDYQNFKDSFVAFITTDGAGVPPKPKGNPTPGLVRELAPILIYERLAAVMAYDAVIPDAPVGQLHALRIEFKKFRYTVEYFREVLGPQSKGIIDELKTLQDHLGDLNDAEVATQILQEFLKDQTKKAKQAATVQEAESQAIVAYMAYRQEERDRLKQNFPDAWAYFNRPEFRQNLALAVSVL
jgi:CHAD domain-containing protein